MCSGNCPTTMTFSKSMSMFQNLHVQGFKLNLPKLQNKRSFPFSPSSQNQVIHATSKGKNEQYYGWWPSISGHHILDSMWRVITVLIEYTTSEVYSTDTAVTHRMVSKMLSPKHYWRKIHARPWVNQSFKLVTLPYDVNRQALKQ